jgi:hypothetical protein
MLNGDFEFVHDLGSTVVYRCKRCKEEFKSDDTRSLDIVHQCKVVDIEAARKGTVRLYHVMVLASQQEEHLFVVAFDIGDVLGTLTKSGFKPDSVASIKLAHSEDHKVLVSQSVRT